MLLVVATSTRTLCASYIMTVYVDEEMNAYKQDSARKISEH